MSSTEEVVKRLSTAFDVACRITLVKLAFFEKLFGELAKHLPGKEEKKILAEAILRVLDSMDDELFLIQREEFDSKDRLEQALQRKFGSKDFQNRLVSETKTAIKKLYPDLDLQ